jgi:hypothetical protein
MRSAFSLDGVTLQSVRFADPYYGFVLTSVAGPLTFFFPCASSYGFWISLYHLYGLVVLGPHWCSVGFLLPLIVFLPNRDIYEKGCFGVCFWGTVSGLRSQFIYVAN